MAYIKGSISGVGEKYSICNSATAYNLVHVDGGKQKMQRHLIKQSNYSMSQKIVFAIRSVISTVFSSGIPNATLMNN